MPVTKAIRRQHSAAWILPLNDGTPGNYITSGPIGGADDEIPFDYIADAGPEWAASEGAASTEFVEVLVANGVNVQYAKETTAVNGETGAIKSGSGGGGTADKLKFTSLEWGKTLAAKIPALRGKLCVFCIPIGDNVTSTEHGWYYMLGKFSSAISYDAKGEEVVSVGMENTASSATANTAGDTALTWAPDPITPVGKTVALTPVPLVSGDLVKLKAGEIIVK